MASSDRDAPSRPPVAERVLRVSVAVHSVEDALAFYRDALGLPVVSETVLPENELRVVRLDAAGLQIELLEPTSGTGPVARYLDRYGEGLHHIAIEVQAIEDKLEHLTTHGVELIDREPRVGPEGKIAFVHPRSTGGVLIELNEARDEPSRRAEELQ